MDELEKLRLIYSLKEQLKAISEDVIQSLIGEKVPNLIEKKKEFIRIHNQLRELEGKQPREIQ